MKKEKKNIAILVIVWGLSLNLSSTAIHAQETDSLLEKQLNEVVISASRSEQQLEDVGKSVTIITADDLKNSVYNSVSELLSQQEGFNIIGTGQNPGSLQGLYLRGSNTKHASVYIDGVRISDPSSPDNAIDLSELSLLDVERIEIIRGTQSTLYGSSTVGGMVNIITKKNSEKGFHTTADVKAGTFGKGTSLFSENLFLNYTTEKGFYVNGEVLNLNSSGLDAAKDTITIPTTYNVRDKDGFQKTDLAGKVGFKNKKWDAYGSYRKAQQVADIDDGAYKEDGNYTLQFDRHLFTYGVSYNISEKLKVQYSGGYSMMERVNTDDSSIVSTTGATDKTYFKAIYDGGILNNEVQVNLKLKKADFVLGAGQYSEKMNIETDYYSTLFGLPAYTSKSNLDTFNIKAATNNLFFHTNLGGDLVNEKIKALNLGLGFRFNNHSNFGNTFTYEINPSIKMSENGILYFMYSTGFNAPSLYQLYTPEKDYVSGIVRGNSKLKAENSSSFETGIRQKINKNMFFSFALFKTVVENTIDYVYLWDKNVGIDTLGNDWMRNDYRGDTYINIGKQTTQGIEINVSSKLNEKFEVRTNVSLINGRVDFEPGNIDTSNTHGNHVQLYNNGAFLNKEVEAIGLVRRPNIANISFIYKPNKKLLLRSDIRYVSSKEDIFYDATLGPYGALNTSSVSDYTLCDIGAKYSFNKHFFASLRIENIFNVKYEEIKGYNTRGRGFYLNLNYTL